MSKPNRRQPEAVRQEFLQYRRHESCSWDLRVLWPPPRPQAPALRPLYRRWYSARRAPPGANMGRRARNDGRGSMTVAYRHLIA